MIYNASGGSVAEIDGGSGLRGSLQALARESCWLLVGGSHGDN